MQLLPPFVLQRLAAAVPTLYFVCFGFWFDLRSCAVLNEDRSKIWAYWPVPNIRPFHLREQIQHWYGRLVGLLESWEPSELAQNTFIYDVSLKSLSPPQSHGLSDDTVELQKTCEALEARVNAKRRRGPSAGRT